VGAHHSIIGRYERDEVKPTIDVVKKLAQVLNTSVAFLLGESQDSNILQDTNMLKRLNDINELPKKDKENILYTIDGLIRDAKARVAYS
jgi:transcriptional regulator with XRE-family HTH domain